MSNELKPCPFCGRECEIGYYFSYADGYQPDVDEKTTYIIIECYCGCTMKIDVTGVFDVERKETYAIEKWNERW